MLFILENSLLFLYNKTCTLSERSHAMQKEPQFTKESHSHAKAHRGIAPLFKLIAALLLLISLFPILGFCINTIVCFSTLNDIKSLSSIESTEEEYILVLGAGIQANGQPSPILQERLDTAVQLYKKNVSDKIIISGGADTVQSETAVMRNYLLHYDIPEEDILTDNHGDNTYASITNLAQVYDAHSVVIVSQRFHLYRALYIAKHFDINATGCIASEIDITNHELIYREFLARIKDFVQVHLGDTIWPDLDN